MSVKPVSSQQHIYHNHSYSKESPPSVTEEKDVPKESTKPKEGNKEVLDIAGSVMKLVQKVTTNKNIKKNLKLPLSMIKLAKLLLSNGAEQKKAKKSEEGWAAYIKQGMDTKKSILVVGKVVHEGCKLLGISQVVDVAEKIFYANKFIDSTYAILGPNFSLNPAQFFGTEKERSALIKNLFQVVNLAMNVSTMESVTIELDTLRNVEELFRFNVSIFGVNKLMDTMSLVRREGVQALTIMHLLDCTHTVLNLVTVVVDTRKQITLVALGVVSLAIGAHHLWTYYQESKQESTTPKSISQNIIEVISPAMSTENSPAPAA